ncbi:MAG: lytic transglycosylase domain-containing protein [Cardiobacteriaceae bacterium]|nr:lytic transglycosylase domain-containing protein [Cardiobacteriaceae bacterium]
MFGVANFRGTIRDTAGAKSHSVNKVRHLFCLSLLLFARAVYAEATEVPQLYRQVAAHYGVPGEGLYRFAITQSARQNGVQTMPWPWTVMVDGHRYQFPDRIAMFNWLLANQGKRSIVFGFDNRRLDSQTRKTLWAEMDVIAMLQRTASLIATPAESGPFLSLPGGQADAKLASLIARVSQETGVDAQLLHAVTAQESAYKVRARSHKGAMGLMQLMPNTARDLGLRPDQYYEPYANLYAGAVYLKRQLNTFGSVELALAAYNAGPNAVRRYKGIPPYRETQNYVARISTNYRQAQRLQQKSKATKQQQLSKLAQRAATGKETSVTGAATQPALLNPSPKRRKL